METASNETTPSLSSVPPPFSHETFLTLELCLYMLVTGTFAAFGVLSNVANLLVFSRQGVLANGSATVSMTCLAVTDLGSCVVTLSRVLILYPVHFSHNESVRASAYSVSILVSAYVGLFVQMTCGVTAFMTLERALVILQPFKFKAVFTPVRSLVVVISICVLSLVIDCPVLIKSYLDWTTNPETNTSYIHIYFTGHVSQEWNRVQVIISPVILRFTAVIIVIGSNAVLIWNIRLSQNFRKSATAPPMTICAAKPSSSSSSSSSSSLPLPTPLDPSAKLPCQPNNITAPKPHHTTSNKATQTKDLKLGRLIATISAVFTVCYVLCVPYSVLFDLAFTRGDYHRYLHHVAWEAVSLVQTINASTNACIYFRMSRRYRQGLLTLMTCGKRK